MMNIPQELQSTLDGLAESFHGLEEDSATFRTGDAIIKNCLQSGGAGSVNVIPGGVPGDCHSVLLVAFGSDESTPTLRNRLGDAVEHVSVWCKSTRLVVFYAGWWSAIEWSRKRETFQKLGVPCVLMMPFTEPQQLR